MGNSGVGQAPEEALEAQRPFSSGSQEHEVFVGLGVGPLVVSPYKLSVPRNRAGSARSGLSSIQTWRS